MKITICGSNFFYQEMLDIKKQLEHLGHQVKLPPSEVRDANGKMIPVKEIYAIRKAETSDAGWIWDSKAESMHVHFQKVEWSDAIIVLNYDKNNIQNYIGGNTLMEMGVAFYLNKKIFLLNGIPDISYKEEIIGMKPVIINKDLTKIN